MSPFFLMSPALRSFTFLAAIPGLLTTQPETHIAFNFFNIFSNFFLDISLTYHIYSHPVCFPFATSEKGLVPNDIFHNLLNLVGKRDKSSLPFWIKFYHICKTFFKNIYQLHLYISAGKTLNGVLSSLFRQKK